MSPARAAREGGQDPSPERIERIPDDIGCVAVLRRPDHLWIDKLYVALGAQRRGIGAQVLRLVVAEAARERLPVRLSVLVTNPALAFYLRNGMRIEAETPERRILSTPGGGITDATPSGSG